jgi:hypothetical protein
MLRFCDRKAETFTCAATGDTWRPPAPREFGKNTYRKITHPAPNSHNVVGFPCDPLSATAALVGRNLSQPEATRTLARRGSMESIANYFPDFVVKRTAKEMRIVETARSPSFSRVLEEIRAWSYEA